VSFVWEHDDEDGVDSLMCVKEDGREESVLSLGRYWYNVDVSVSLAQIQRVEYVSARMPASQCLRITFDDAPGQEFELDGED
jgi:hypothetical protein